MNPLRIYSPEPKLHASEDLWQRFLIHPLRIFFGDGSPEWPQYRHSFEFYERLYKYEPNPQIADYHVLPLAINYYYQYGHKGLLNEAYQRAEKLNKKLLIWVEGDYDVNKHFNNAIYLKNASFKSKGIVNEVIRPADVREDLLKKHYQGQLKIRNKPSKPKVGFVGLASYPTHKLLGLIAQGVKGEILASLNLSAFDPPPVLPLLLKRKKLLSKLERHPQVATDFIIRERFAQGVRDKEHSARNEFIKNIYNTDYTFCLRGSANYSIRFYETLCLGRIPLFVNTDCVLPFEDKIDWSSAVLWINESDENKIAEALIDFHNAISPKEFEERQRYCREIWLKYLSKEGFENFLVKDLKSLK